MAFVAVTTTGCGRFGFELEPGAGPVEADASVLATSCGQVPSLVCDGFESSTLTGWTADTGVGTLAIISDAPYRGAYALRATAGMGGHAYLAVDLAPLSSGEVHVRGYLRMPSGVPIDVSVFPQLFRVGREPDAGHVHVMVDSSDRPMVWPDAGVFTGTTPVARDRWVCMTLAIRIDGSNGSFDLAFDGVSAVALAGIDLTSSAGGFDEFSVGLIDTGAGQAPLSIDLDEVSVSTTPRACD